MANSISDKAKEIYNRVKAGFSRDQYEDSHLPKKGAEKLGEVVYVLLEESRVYKQHNFAETKDDRFGYSDPRTFWNNLARLESGNHYEVYGRRNENNNEKWKQEIVDDEIQRQIRTRSNYVNANWHDVQINPNVENISEIFDQERHATDWGKQIRQWQKRASIYGDSWLKTILDKSINKDGLVKEEVCEVGSVYLTPFARTKLKSDGCWYIIHAGMITDKQIESTYPDINIEELEVMTEDKASKMMLADKAPVSKSLVYTRIYDKLELWCDDQSQEQIPFTPAETEIEHATVAKGGDITAHEVDNHSEHIKKHQEWLAGLGATVPEDQRTPEDTEKLQALEEYMSLHITEHEEMIEASKEEGLKRGFRFKYPYGRKIVVIAGVVAEDVPNPYGTKGCDWRMLFNQLKNEDIPGRIDGRSDVEILWNTNKHMDQALSRVADNAITAGIPKQWFHKLDKKNIDGQLSNDPLEPGYYDQQPPVFRQAAVAKENFEIYTAMKANAKEDLGVSKAVRGEAPTRNSPNKLAETLLRQSEVLVTGELNTNMADAIEDVVETRIMLWKKFYTKPRFWFINGEKKAINLSKLLSVMKVKDPETGEEKEEEITKFEIFARPGSNFPNRWENMLTTLIDLAEIKEAPEEMKQGIWLMLRDLMAERFPQLAPNGEYYIKSKALVLGMQELQKQQEAEEKNQKGQAQIEQMLKQKAARHLVGKDIALTPNQSSQELEPQAGGAGGGNGQ